MSRDTNWKAGETWRRVERVFAARDAQEVAAIYDDWSEEYDPAPSAWAYQTKIAALCGQLGRYASRDAMVLDAGAGTGCIGAALALMGQRRVVAVDISQGMLDVAAARGIYDALHCADLADLPFEDDTFDATVASGVFATGHAPASAFDELIRVTRPGGSIIFNARVYCMREAGYSARIESLVEAGRCTVDAVSPLFDSVHPAADDEAEARDCIRVLRVT